MATMTKVFAAYRQRLATLQATEKTNPLAKGVAWVEGELVPLKEARIPLVDQGFMHGDLTYDVPAVWDGRFFRLDDHINRLEASCGKIRLNFPLSKEEIKRILLDMVSKSGIKDAFVEIIVTRGNAKFIHADYPFLTDGDANITEGSGFNVIFVKGGVIYTPDRGVLEGVTRKSVFDAAKANSIEVRIEVVPTELVYKSEEIFMCTTAGGIMPITSLDGKPIGDGKVGPVTKAIWDEYWAMHYNPKYSMQVHYGGNTVNGTNGVH